MAPVQTQTMTTTTHHPQFTNPLPTVLSTRLQKPPTRSTRTSKPLLSYSPQIPTPHPDINLPLLRNKLLLTCRAYIPSRLLHTALADGLYSRATHWITPASQTASKHGKRKRYYVLHSDTFDLQPVGSAWEARVVTSSQPIDAGNGVVLFVKERKEWDAFLSGYRRQGKRAGQLLKSKEKEREREWREKWRRRCAGEDEGSSGSSSEEGRKKGSLREAYAGPMWVLVKSAVARIVKGEA